MPLRLGWLATATWLSASATRPSPASRFPATTFSL